MRASSLVLTLVAFASAACATPNAVEARNPQPTQPPAELVERQLGGGGGVQTSIDQLQTISGYTPPPSSQIPDPVVSQGRIVPTNSIPGFNSSSSSGAMPQMNFQPAQMALAAAGGAAAGLTYLLF